MMDTIETEASDCPFLMGKLRNDQRRVPAAVYCRSPSGRVRVPTREQLVFLCTAGQHHDCPGYRRWVERRRR